MMETGETTRQAIAGYLRRIADWRRQRFEDFDRDPRHLRAAAGLDELADYVLALPADDPRLLALGELAMEGELFVPGQQASYEIGRFRFHHAQTTLDGFLGHLVELALADANEHGNFAGRLPPGDNPWG